MSIVVRHALNQPFERVERVLREGVETWIPGLRDGTLIVVGAALFHHSLGGPLRVTARRSLIEPGHVEFDLDLRPEDTRHHPLPRFQGWLSATALPRRHTRIALHLAYVPPGGRLGSLVDRTALAGLAASMVAELADAITATIVRRATLLAFEVPALAGHSAAGEPAAR